MKTFCFILLAVFSLTSARLNASDAVKPYAGPKVGPYKGKIPTIPGLIEAEHYDEGPAGKSYFDVDEKNRGVNYRGATQVDIEKRSDASNGHGVGWLREKEWQIYTVHVKESGTYRLKIPVASKKEGGLFHIEIDGKDVTGPMRVPDTGGWRKLKVIEHEKVVLKKGVHRMKVVMDKDGPSGGIGDIDCYKFVKALKSTK